jgi:hypothetical protein
VDPKIYTEMLSRVRLVLGDVVQGVLVQKNPDSTIDRYFDDGLKPNDELWQCQSFHLFALNIPRSFVGMTAEMAKGWARKDREEKELAKKKASAKKSQALKKKAAKASKEGEEWSGAN